MASRQNVSDSTYVVGAADGAPTEQLERSLADLGEVQRVDAQPYLLITLGDGAADLPRLTKRVGAHAWVEPAVVSPRGDIEIPTGDISVRFQQDPSEPALESFASEHELSVQRRSEFVPEQVVFRPRKPAKTSLVELASKLDDRSDVEMAWVNTLSRPRRGR
jgi:hypothetical protein